MEGSSWVLGVWLCSVSTGCSPCPLSNASRCLTQKEYLEVEPKVHEGLCFLSRACLSALGDHRKAGVGAWFSSGLTIVTFVAKHKPQPGGELSGSL